MLGAAIAMLWVAGSLGAQMTGGQAQAAEAAAQSATAPSGSEPTAAPAAAAPSAQASRAGRRDPFRALVVQGAGDQLPVCKSPGKGALIVGQVRLQGIVRGINGQWIAVVDNNTKRAFFLYVGDVLCNGTVSSITADDLVIEERITDQAGRTRSREVVKQLTPN
jgi:hypothetical protein